MLTKLCLPLSVWWCWVILLESCCFHINNYYTELALCLSHYMASNCDITKKYFFFSLLRSWRKYSKEQCYGLQVYFIHCYHSLEAIAGLIPIHMYLNKISRRYYLQVASLPQQHALNSLMDKHYSKKTKSHYLSIAHLTCKQWSKIKSSIVDTNNYLNEVFPLFNRFYKELSPGFHLEDMFPNHFSFHTVNHKNTNTKTYYNKLNKIFEEFLLNLNTILIISNASVKKKVATSISHVQKNHNIIAKTTHHTMNVTSTEVELFSIRCKINLLQTSFSLYLHNK